MELCQDDCKSLLVHFKDQEKRLRLKRRWLMGLPMSKFETKKLKGTLFHNDRIIPESMLREDDVQYRTVKTFVEKGFGVCGVEREHHVVQDNMQLFDLHNDIRNLFSLLDNMTNKGLCHFAEILTGGSMKFEKNRWKIKKIIKECLPEILRNRNDNHQMNEFIQLSQLLKDPNNFRGNHVAHLNPTSPSYRAAAMKVLNGLEDLPKQTLTAMHRKLRGIQGYMPRLQLQGSERNRGRLIPLLRKRCLGMLSQFGEGDELQEPLAKVMAVAGLTLKLILGFHSVKEFRQFSPEIKALQNEISRAIWLLNNKVSFPVLKNLQLLLDPNFKLPSKSLRYAVRNLLIDFLFECSDMDTIPECLLETLSIINKSSQSAPYRFNSKKEVEEDVECILNVSAQTKQILWDLLPEHEFDQDFADAYMEDLEESYDCDGYDDDEQQVEFPQNIRFHFKDSNDPIESVGEISPINPKSPASITKGDGSSPVLTPNRRLNSKLKSMHISEMDSADSYVSTSSSSSLKFNFLDSAQNMDENQYQFGSEGQEPTIDSAKPPDFVSSSFSCGEANIMHDKQSMNRNLYLSVQEATDDTSMVAYRLIGRILEEFALIEGLELELRDVLYLRGYGLIPEVFRVAKEDHRASCEEDVCGTVVIPVLEELIPSFPKSGKERVKELMGLK